MLLLGLSISPLEVILHDKSEAFYKLIELMANNWKNLPVWVCLTNEPIDIGDWSLCKPILQKAATNL